ncbi:MAG: hypothetical protein HXY36_04480 [Chloroflexi bacterium]|nr:hypothetical protein [Chloroflexota bacterium]
MLVCQFRHFPDGKPPNTIAFYRTCLKLFSDFTDLASAILKREQDLCFGWLVVQPRIWRLNAYESLDTSIESQILLSLRLA